MPADMSITDNSYLDSAASTLVPRFQQFADNGTGTQVSTDTTGPYWTASEVRLNTGRNPSTAVCHIPLAASTDETAPTVAGITSSPVLSGIKIGTPVGIYDQYSGGEQVVFTGYVEKIIQNLKDDTATVHCVDARWMLDSIFVIGQLFYNATSNTVSYRQGWRCVMNENGQPNCCPDMDGRPVFCVANMGLTVGEEPATDISASYDNNGKPQATYWTPQLALDYFYRMFADGSTTAYTTAFPWFTQIPGNLSWPISLSSATMQVNSLTLNSYRKAAEYDFEGMKLTDVLQRLCEAAGPYALFIEPQSDSYGGTLQVVRTRYDGTNAISVARATGGNANPDMDDVVFTAGEICDDGRDTYTRFVVAGDNVHIEIRLSTVDGSLRKGWDNATFTNWKNYQVTNGSTTVPGTANSAFEQANSEYNKVLRCYRIEPTFDFQQGTTEASYPRAEAGRPPLPHLLSSFLEGTGSTLADRIQAPYDIRFEYSTDGGATWFLASGESGLSIDPVDGAIYVDALRKSGTAADTTWSGVTWSGSLLNPGSITANDVRVTLAIPCDHRLTVAQRLAVDQSAALALSGDSNEDNSSIYKGTTRLWYADAAHLYAKDIPNTTVGDWPVPQSVAGATAQTNTLRDDTAFAQQHLNRKTADYGRVNRSGRLVYPHLYSMFRPGYQIQDMLNVGASTSTFPIRAVCVAIVFQAGKGQNATVLMLG